MAYFCEREGGSEGIHLLEICDNIGGEGRKDNRSVKYGICIDGIYVYKGSNIEGSEWASQRLLPALVTIFQDLAPRYS